MNQAETGAPGSRVAPAYPPPPWHLQGQLYGSIWTVPQAACRVEIEPAFRPLAALGRVGVFAGFVDYQPGSILVYHELLAGLVVRLQNSWRLAFTVTHMWVDNLASLQGGRKEWGVPKEAARFDFDFQQNFRDLDASARDNSGQLLAAGSFVGRGATPARLRLPVIFPDLQILNNRVHSASGTFWSRLELCRGGIKIPEESPLADLGICGRAPLVNFGGLDFKMRLKAARPLRR